MFMLQYVTCIKISINTCIPSLALPLIFLRKSGDTKLLWSATSNAPAPGITQPTTTSHSNKTVHVHLYNLRH